MPPGKGCGQLGSSTYSCAIAELVRNQPVNNDAARKKFLVTVRLTLIVLSIVATIVAT